MRKLALLLVFCASAAAAADVTVVRNAIREYAVGDLASGPAMVAVDENDDVWVALAKSGRLARLRNNRIDTFDIGANSRPVGLVALDGVLWIAASYDNKLIRFDPRSKAMQEFPIDGDSSWPFVVAAGNSGTLWFSERAAGRIGRFDPATGKYRHYDLPTPNAGPAGLAVDRSSGAVWFSESYADRIARLDPATGVVSELAMGDKSTGLVTGPAGLTVDANGDVWFAKLEGKLGHVPKGSTSIELIDTPSDARRPAGIIADARGHLWLVSLDGNCIVEYAPGEHSFALYPLPTGSPDAKPSTPPVARSARPFGIAADRDGNIWFSEQYAGQLGVVDVAAPAVAIFSPGPTVRTASTPLTMQALDRVSDVRTLSTTIDGQPARLRDGRLDLAALAPGDHRLEVTAADGAGHRTTAALSFRYAPSALALQELVERSETANAQAKAALLKDVQSLASGDPRATLARIRQTIDGRPSPLRGTLVAPLRAAVAFQEQTAGANVEVRILDAAPYFAPPALALRPGDTVRFKYDPPSDGHTVSHALQRLVIAPAGVSSGMLRAGESFSYRFERAGEFTVTNAERTPDAMLAIRVATP